VVHVVDEGACEVRGSSSSEANAPRGRGRRATTTITIELGPWLLALVIAHGDGWMDVCMPGCVDVY